MATIGTSRTLAEVNSEQSHWYVSDNGRVFGPYLESQIRWGLQEGRITGEMTIRQNQSSWLHCSVVRQAFNKLEREGYFVHLGGEIAGPFTKHKLSAMLEQGELLSTALVRHGTSSDWRTLDAELRVNHTGGDAPLVAEDSTAANPDSALVATTVVTELELMPEDDELADLNSWEDEYLAVDLSESGWLADPLADVAPEAERPIATKLIPPPNPLSITELTKLVNRLFPIDLPDRRFLQFVVSPIWKCGLQMLSLVILCHMITDHVSLSLALGLCAFTYCFFFRYRLHKDSFFQRQASRWHGFKHRVIYGFRRKIRRVLLTAARKLC